MKNQRGAAVASNFISVFAALLCLSALAAEALDPQAVYDDVAQRVSDQIDGKTPVSDRAREAVASAQKQIEDLKKKVQAENPGLWEQVKGQVNSGSDRVSEAYASATSGGKTRTAYQKGKDGAQEAVASAQKQLDDLKKKVQAEDPGLWEQVKAQVNSGSDRVSEAYASATSGGKTKTAYQKGKDGAASAYSYASDVAETVGQQAEAAKRAATGQKKSAWQKAKDFVGGSGLFVHAEAAPTPVRQAYEDTKAYAASLSRSVADRAQELYASATGSSSRASASDTYFRALDKAHSAYDGAVRRAQAQYASAAEGGSDAAKAAKKTYEEAHAKASAKREGAAEQAQQAWRKASDAVSSSEDAASKKLGTAVDSARAARDKAYKKAEAAYDSATVKADATQTDAAKAYDSAAASAKQTYVDAVAKAQSAYEQASRSASSAGDSTASSLDSVKDSASHAYDSAAESVAGAYDKAADGASQAYDSAAEGASKAYDKSAELASEASKQLQASFKDYGTWSADALERAQAAVQDASKEVANFVNAKTSQPTSSTEQAYKKAKQDLESNLAAARARVSEALGITTKEADSQWVRLSKQWDSASASVKNALTGEWGTAQKSQSKLSLWLTEAESGLGSLYDKAATEAEQKWEAVKKVSADATSKIEL